MQANNMLKPTDMGRARSDSRPLIAHIIHKLDYGGLENGVVNLINRMPHSEWRHCVICMTDFTEFRKRIERPDVPVIALHKPEGKAWATYLQLWRVLRQMQPDIVHTRNLAALEGQVPAFLAGIRGRVHSEHGWDVGDLDGSNRRRRLLRRLVRPFVRHYIALSQDIECYLRDSIGVESPRLTQIYNGVDDTRFAPQILPAATPWVGMEPFVFGTVGRVQAVKDQLTLLRAFALMLQREPQARSRLRLMIVGDGPLLPQLQQEAVTLGVSDLLWLPGSRDDVPALMRAMNVFVLPSLSEGISNTILEAMACRLPVIATRVGGNPELIEAGQTGALVPAAEVQQLADAMTGYWQQPALASQQGQKARKSIENRFGMQRMLDQYVAVYRKVL